MSASINALNKAWKCCILNDRINRDDDLITSDKTKRKKALIVPSCFGDTIDSDTIAWTFKTIWKQNNFIANALNGSEDNVSMAKKNWR